MTREETVAKLTAILDDLQSMRLNCGALVAKSDDASEYALGIRYGRTYSTLCYAIDHIAQIRAELRNA